MSLVTKLASVNSVNKLTVGTDENGFCAHEQICLKYFMMILKYLL